MKFAVFDFPRRRGTPAAASPLDTAGLSVDAAAMEPMQSQSTDIEGLPRRYRTWLPLSGLTANQFGQVLALVGHTIVSPACGRPWGLPLPIRLLLVLIHLRKNLTTRALAALFNTSQSTIDRIIHHLIPVLADAVRPTGVRDDDRPWIIDGTLIPVHDQPMTAISKNYRRSVNTQIIISADNHRVIAVGACWPGNRNDIVVARHTVADLIDGSWTVPGDGGYRGITTITGPGRGPDGQIIRDHHWRSHRRIRARVEHVIARIKDWQILRQCRRRGQAINHSLQIVAGLWNLKTYRQLRVSS